MKFNYINPNNYGSLLINQDEKNRVMEVLKSKRLFRFSSNTQSSQNSLLEKELKNVVSSNGGVLLVSNGTAALRGALFAIGLKPGDCVLVSSYTFIATISAVLSFGATPIPFDLDHNLQIDMKDIESRITSKVKAIIPVHVAGHIQKLDELERLSKKQGIPIIEDACQAMGAEYHGNHAGTMGKIGVVSFQENKLLTCGEGGAVFAKEKEVIQCIQKYSDHGAYRQIVDNVPNWDHELAGFGDNLRMSEVQAAILREQLKRLPRMLERQRIAKAYVKDQMSSSECRIIESPDLNGDTGQALLFEVENENIARRLIEFAKRDQILIKYVWPRAYYQYKVFDRFQITPKKLGVKPCKKLENLAPQLLCLPLPVILTEYELEEITKRLKKLLRNK